MKIKDLTGFNTKELVEGRHGSFTNYYDSDGNDLRGGHDEANLWYRYDPQDGRLKQNMIAGHQEREARNLGYRDSQEAALRVHDIVKSKYHKGKWIQNQGGKWVEVHPFGKPQGVAETASAGATSAGNIASVEGGAAAYSKKPVKSVNALDQNSVSLFGGPMEDIKSNPRKKVAIVKRR